MGIPLNLTSFLYKLYGVTQIDYYQI